MKAQKKEISREAAKPQSKKSREIAKRINTRIGAPDRRLCTRMAGARSAPEQFSSFGAFILLAFSREPFFLRGFAASRENFLSANEHRVAGLRA
ncbi:MAG: hypothetical protein ABL973_16300 [Micropepsaceae bacterium]